MSTLFDLREKLQDITATLTKVEEIAAKSPHDRSVSLTISSLQRRQKDLEAAFAAEAGKERVDI